YVNTSDGMLYLYNSELSAFENTGVKYQTTGIATEGVETINLSDKSVTNDKIDIQAVTLDKIDYPVIYAKKSKNLFNKNALIRGYYVKYSSGTLGVNASYSVLFIPIEPLTTYVHNGDE